MKTPELVPIQIYGQKGMLPSPVMLPKSQLVKRQRRLLEPRRLKGEIVVPEVRWDDECGDGHNSFSVAAMVYGKDRIMGETTIQFDGKTYWCCGGGCCHDTIEKSHPEIAHLIKWHLVSSDGPMHYIPNTLYHALENGPNMAWIEFEDLELPVPIKKQSMLYTDLDKAKAICEKDKRYSMRIDEKTAKANNLDHARSSACWPEATDEQLALPPKKLEALLVERLPALMLEFYKDITDFGFTY